MGSVNIKGTVSSLVPAGTPSPLRLSAPQQIRSLTTGLPSGVASSLAKDLDDVNRVVNQLHTNQQTSPAVTQLLLTNAAGQVTAAFGSVAYQGVPYTNYLSEIHVGNPLKTQNPQESLFNANLDGSVTIGQNGWIDVHDPFDGNAAWIGTQYDTIVISGAVNNGSGEIRITATGHTLSAPDNLVAAVRGLNLWNIPNGNGTWTVTVIDANTLDLNGSIWSGPYEFMGGDLPSGLPTYQATIQRVLLIAGITKPATVIEIETAIAHTYETGDRVSIPLPATATVASQWTITKIDATHFTLNDSTAAVVGDFAGATTCLRYFAGILAQTIAIGDSFADYKLREFADGSLRIKNAIIDLVSANGEIVLDPAIPSISLTSTAGNTIVVNAATTAITLTSTAGNTISLSALTTAVILTNVAGSKVTLDASNGSIVLNAPTGLAKVVLDASVPNIVLYNSVGLKTVEIKSNGDIISGGTISGGFTGSFTSTAGANPNVLTLSIANGLLNISGIGTQAGNGNITIDGSITAANYKSGAATGQSLTETVLTSSASGTFLTSVSVTTATISYTPGATTFTAVTAVGSASASALTGAGGSSATYTSGLRTA